MNELADDGAGDAAPMPVISGTGGRAMGDISVGCDKGISVARGLATGRSDLAGEAMENVATEPLSSWI